MNMYVIWNEKSDGIWNMHSVQYAALQQHADKIRRV